MYKFGFLIDAIGPSQHSVYLTQQVNALVDKRPDFAPCVFYRGFDKIIVKPLFALLNCYETWSFDGIAIATDIYSAKLLLKCPGPAKRFFYVWNMEWAFNTNTNHTELEEVYLNDKLPLITRSRYHYEILERIWQPPVEILEEFNHEQLASFIKKQSEDVQ